MEITLTPELDAFVEGLVASGSFSNESEVVEAALLLLEQGTNELTSLREKMVEARAEFERGDVVRESATFWEDLRREAVARATRGVD